jgi:hypothetical protein
MISIRKDVPLIIESEEHLAQMIETVNKFQ